MRGPSTMRRMTPNIALNLTAQERRSWVPVALRAPAPGQPERSASCGSAGSNARVGYASLGA